MVSARNTSTAAIRWSVKLFMIDNLFGGFERKYRKLFFPILLLCRISCYICMNFMVMERRLFIFCFLAVVVWQSVALAAGTSSFTALTASLDEAIEAHRHYVAVREGRIARLKRQLLDADTANLSFFRWNGEIYKEYKAYICDSAIHYLRVNLDWAERYGQRNAALETRLELAHLMASAGMYEEAAELLRQTDKASLPTHLMPDYYNACHKLYTELSFYTLDDSFKKHYQALATHYDDSLMQVLLPSSPLYLERRETREAAAGHPDEALSINDTRLAHAKPNTPEYALVTYQRSLLYRRLGNREEEKRYLALSALTDIRLSITDHASLWNLAELLYEEGDMEHAYRYIRFSWDETNRYNARSRSLQTAGILSLIDLTYQAVPLAHQRFDCAAGGGSGLYLPADAAALCRTEQAGACQRATATLKQHQGGVCGPFHEPLLRLYQPAGYLPADGQQENLCRADGRAAEDGAFPRGAGHRTEGTL